ncbi:hypothetical protein LOTGIDRAFT_161258 [Lottia gigantea]|uniref:Uncharacterized protein n=1 Tax=Lottia gigantea TaxID=225164 RepID=V4ACI8_LOTGI|nr:hypothetical protein LOTGIDRAFT_161258 [Lottia gigantea]ESO94557.1 hypothetical protein LOTGIDRAFT_161258 [Lottia gigantea]
MLISENNPQVTTVLYETLWFRSNAFCARYKYRGFKHGCGQVLNKTAYLHANRSATNHGHEWRQGRKLIFHSRLRQSSQCNNKDVGQGFECQLSLEKELVICIQNLARPSHKYSLAPPPQPQFRHGGRVETKMYPLAFTQPGSNPILAQSESLGAVIT